MAGQAGDGGGFRTVAADITEHQAPPVRSGLEEVVEIAARRAVGERGFVDDARLEPGDVAYLARPERLLQDPAGRCRPPVAAGSIQSERHPAAQVIEQRGQVRLGQHPLLVQEHRAEPLRAVDQRKLGCAEPVSGRFGAEPGRRRSSLQFGAQRPEHALIGMPDVREPGRSLVIDQVKRAPLSDPGDHKHRAEHRDVLDVGGSGQQAVHLGEERRRRLPVSGPLSQPQPLHHDGYLVRGPAQGPRGLLAEPLGFPGCDHEQPDDETAGDKRHRRQRAQRVTEPRR